MTSPGGPPRTASPLSPAPVGTAGVTRLAALLDLVDSWPQLRELRLAAVSNATSCHHRRRHAASSLAACSRTEMTAALLAQRSRALPLPGLPLRAELDAAVVVLCGAARHASLAALQQGGLRSLAASWGLPEKDLLMAESFVATVIGPPTVFGAASLPTIFYSADLGAWVLSRNGGSTRYPPPGGAGGSPAASRDVT